MEPRTFSFTIHWDAGNLQGTSLLVETFPNENVMLQWVADKFRDGIAIPQGDSTLHLPSESIILIESREIDDPTDN